MKLSVAWIFDHIDADWHTVDIAQMVKLFNEKTAEIETVRRVKVACDQLSLAVVVASDDKHAVVQSVEWKEQYSLPARADVVVGNYFMIKKQKDGTIVWAMASDFGSDKDHAMPALLVDNAAQPDAWKHTIEKEDSIIEIDNKSITNRPDMWGHRGVAREIAALLDLPLRPWSEFVHDIPVATTGKAGSFSITNKAPDACDRFAGLHVSRVVHQPSAVWMAARLARLDSRPIDMLVDATNYVMLETSQPMHAFDAQKITTSTVVPRMAQDGETLTLLDGQEITLSADDLVITDGKQPIALAGIKGGASTAVSTTTRSLFVEAAHFDPTTIRKTSERHKLRTEGSARFEKNIDPAQNVDALMRFVALLDGENVPYEYSGSILSLGQLPEPTIIMVAHAFLVARLGTPLTHDFVVKTLTSIGFDVKRNGEEYVCTVPSFRATKDITIKEDIVEEIGRFYGYGSIEPQAPTQRVTAADISSVKRIRAIKDILVRSVRMREMQAYSFFDEQFLHSIDWQPTNCVDLKNPVSEQWRRLVTSLVPNVCKAVHDNAADQDEIRFFEWARIWSLVNHEIIERKRLTGIFYAKKESLDFYTVKNDVVTFFETLGMQVSWHRVDAPQYPWFMPYQTARLEYDGTVIGYAGKVHPWFMRSVADGDAFIFDIDGDALLAFHKEAVRFVAASKYPAVERDMSMLLPLKYTVDEVVHTVQAVDSAITSVELIDFFQKDEWKDRRSLTVRFVMHDATKTCTKQEVDAIWQSVADKLRSGFGAEIR